METVGLVCILIAVIICIGLLCISGYEEDEEDE